MSALDRDFARLESALTELLGLLDEADEAFWAMMLGRAAGLVTAHQLAGATYILGCFGGAETFSDLVVGDQWREEDPLRYRNLNARLDYLRTRTYDSANAIAARRNW